MDQQSQPTLDVSTLTTLQDIGDEEDLAFLSQLITSFIQETTAGLTTLRTACQANDAMQLARTAQALQSGSTTIGALGMAALCDALQTVGHSGSVAAAFPLVAQLAAEFTSVQHALQQVRAALPTSPAE
jgi:HPt (histidine-containing phosphotransfer) domain-containing protein